MGPLNRSVIAPLSSAIVTVLIAGLVVAGVDSVDQNKVRKGTARLDPNGLVEVSISGGPYVRASHRRTLRANDHVRVLDGSAVLDLPNSNKVELRTGSAVTVNGAASPEVGLDQGDLLVESGQGDTLTVDGGTALAAVAGSAKLRRGVSLATGVYEGTVRFQRSEQGLTVPQFRQAAVVGTGILPQRAEPLNLSPSDDWDRRMLGPVMALDEQVTLITRSFEAEAPPTPGPDLYKEWSPRVASLPLSPELLGGRAPGENLVGFTMVALDKGDFGERFQRIFGFRAEGASWGLVAADRGINPSPVLSDLESALGKLHPGTLPGDLASPLTPGHGFNIGGRIFPTPRPLGGGSSTGGAGGSGGTGTGGTGGTGTGGTGGTGGSGGSGGGGGGGGGGGNPKVIDVPPTGTFLDPVLNPLVNPVEDLLSGLLGGLLGQTGTTSGSGSTTPLSPVTQPSGTQPAILPTTPTTSPPAGTTGTGSTGTTSGTVSGSVSSGSGGTTTPSPSTTTTTTTGLLGGIVGGLTRTVGGVL